jgi:serine protease Do
VKVMREGKELTLNIKIAEMPESGVVPKTAPTEERLGLTVEDITPHIMRELGLRDRTGVVVTGVAQGSPADDAGIQAGDIIKETNRVPVKNLRDFESAMSKSGKNKPVLFLIKRGAATFYVSIATSE